MKAIVLLNRAAGTLAAMNGETRDQTVARALAEAGIDAEIHAVNADGLALARQAAEQQRVDVVIGGGGDGTLSAVAGIVAGTRVPLGILPLGTLNHFAKDLGIPLDLTAATQIIARKNIGLVDVGELNGRTFVNNSSLGVYPRVVMEREAQRSRFGLRKWTAMALAVLKVFRRFPLVHVRLQTGDQKILRKTPLVFVGNNRYELDLFRIGKRSALNQGELSLYVANTQNRWGMLVLTLRALTGRLQQARDFETFQLKECWIETRRHRLHVAVDGEVIRLKPPLEYRICPQRLLVCLPPANPPATGTPDSNQSNIRTGLPNSP